MEHIKLYSKMDDQEYVVEFDFLGKDSIRYYNKIPVEKRVRRGREGEKSCGRYIKTVILCGFMRVGVGVYVTDM